MAKKVKNRHIYITLIAVVALAFLMFSKTEQTFETIQGGGWDISEQVEAKGYNQYLVEEEDFDYSSPIIQQRAKLIKESTTTPRSAIEKTIKFVVDEIRYSSVVSINYCYEEKASTVLETKVGDCVSMSRLVTSLLRAQGIPARTSGGCLSSLKRCSPLFAVYPEIDAKVVALVEGDFKKRGFLHEWVEVWDPASGWLLVEATAGRAYPIECNSYLQYSYDSNKFNRCVINDINFWNDCRGY